MKSALLLALFSLGAVDALALGGLAARSSCARFGGAACSTAHIAAAYTAAKPVLRTTPLRAQEAAAEPPKSSGLASILPPPKELKKVLPLGLMFFFILFNYTILRDTKDVLVVTAKGSGAEIIPFLKTYVNLPGAIGFTVLYSKLTNMFSRDQVFYGVVSTFVAFFASFAFLIYPNMAALHPHAFADMLTAALPAGFSAPIAIIRNWTFAVFYTMAELW